MTRETSWRTELGEIEPEETRSELRRYRSYLEKVSETKPEVVFRRQLLIKTNPSRKERRIVSFYFKETPQKLVLFHIVLNFVKKKLSTCLSVIFFSLQMLLNLGTCPSPRSMLFAY